MKKLTKREQTLLIILFTGIFLIVGIMYWVLPLKTELDSLKANKNDLTVRKTDMEIKIAQKGSLEAKKEQIESDIDIMLDNVSEQLAGESFDLHLQSLAKLGRFEVTKIGYGPIETITPSAIGTPVQEYEHNLKTLVDLVSGHSPTATTDSETEHELLKQTITIDIKGSYLTVQKLFLDLNNSGPTFFVRNVSYEQKTEQAEILDEEIIATPQKEEKATITVDIYFLEVDRSLIEGDLGQKG